MKQIFHLLFILFFSFSSRAQDTANAWLVKQYTEKAQQYLDKEKALSPFYSIDQQGITMYADQKSRDAQQAEFRLDWKNLRNFCSSLAFCTPQDALKIYASGSCSNTIPCVISGKAPAIYTESTLQKKLFGLKIALDPGHIANDHITGDLEKKHIKFRQDLVRGMVDSVEISEGMLTYATAVLLKQKLEAEGAEVMITRKNGTTAFGKTYDQWKKEDLKTAVDSLFKTGELQPSQRAYFLSPRAQDRDIFRVIFRDLDLAKRAGLINNYQPNLTVIIHFNVDETNLEWTHATKKDLNMTFVGGAFMKNDLSSPEKRFEFLRLLVSNDLERSIALSTSVISSFERVLEVPTAGVHDAKYISESCLPAGKKGVYCRNLQLTRYVHSPLVYGETLFQDNIRESQLLNKEKDKTKNERIQQVAQAYFEGILGYLNTIK
jgi:N-acetylmuramoyl-L-alanine amidase